MKGTPRERFDAKTIPGPGGCLLWTAAKMNRGYGYFWVDGKSVLAHRWVYEQDVGPIPEGMELDHCACFTPLCVNTNHLVPKSHRDNSSNRRGAQSNSATGIRGVYWHNGRSKYYAQVKVGSRQIWGAYFTDIDEAEAAVLEARLRIMEWSDLPERGKQ